MKSSQNKEICYFAKTNFRNSSDVFGIFTPDRLHHFYIVGKTGAGKSNLILTKIVQDLYAGHGICLIDPHGDLVRTVQEMVPYFREQDIVNLDATDPELSLGYNPLRKVSYETVSYTHLTLPTILRV